jgi:Glyoxalase-like domain
MANQLPAPGEVFLDHTAFFVAEIDAAATVLERCGFRLTPFSVQTNTVDGKIVAAGTGNRLAMLRNGYLELLTATPGPAGDTLLAAQLRERIAHHAGLHLATFASADAAAEHRRLGEAGFETLPLVDMRRPVGDAFARFSIARIAHGTMPEGRAQFLTHRTEHLVWLPDMLDHPNGAKALTALWIAADDIAEVAERYTRFTGRRAASDGAVTKIPLDRGALNIVTPAYLAETLGIMPAGPLPCLVAASVAVNSIVTLEACLRGSGIAYRQTAAGIAVALPPALGDTLLFEQPVAP